MLVISNTFLKWIKSQAICERDGLGFEFHSGGMKYVSNIFIFLLYPEAKRSVLFRHCLCFYKSRRVGFLPIKYSNRRQIQKKNGISWNRVFSALIIKKIKSNQLHAVSRTKQGRQREPSVKTLRSPLSAEFWRHCVLSGGTQRCTLPRHQSEEMKI